MFPTRSYPARRIARQLLLLPVLVAGMFVTIVPATAAPKHEVPGATAVQAHQPLFAGDGRKIK